MSPRNPACTACDLYKTATNVCIEGEGPIPAKGMIIGEGPGREEDKTGLPFQGPAGELLNRTLQSVGLQREDLFVTNATRCLPPRDYTKTLLVRKAVKPCRQYLDSELAQVKPEVILLLGAAALQSFTGRQDITKQRGSEFFDEELNAWIVVTVHPAYVLRDPSQLPAFESDLKRFARRMRGEEVAPPPTVHVCLTAEEVDEAFEALMSEERIAFDLETKGFFDWKEDARLWCIGLAAKTDEAWVIPIDHPDAPWGCEHEIRKTIKVSKSGANLKRDEHVFGESKDPAYREKLLIRLGFFLTSKKLIGHNVKFDLRWLDRFGIGATGFFDTMLAAHLLNENQNLSLKNLAQTHLGALAWGKGEVAFDPPAEMSLMGPYCGVDTAYTFALFELFSKELVNHQALARLYKYAIVPALNAYVRAERRGVWIDQKRMDQEELILSEELVEIEKELHKKAFAWKFFNKEEPNFNSTNFLSAWVFGPVEEGCLGLTPVKYTEAKKMPTTDVDSLTQLKGQHEAVDLLLARSEKGRMVTFFKAWRELLASDGRLHPFYRLAGTDTGRNSCSDPNLMQVPKDHRARGVIGAPQGWKFVSLDFSQIELRIAAFLAQEPTMLEAFRAGVDLHTLTAGWISGKLGEQRVEDLIKNPQAVSQLPITAEDRFKAKAVSFGLIYRMGARGLRDYARKSYGVEMEEEEAAAVRDSFFDLYSRLPRWHKRQIAIAGGATDVFGKTLRKADLQVETPLGRVRRLPHIKSTDSYQRGLAERQAINAPVQGTPTDLVRLTLAQLHPMLDDTCYFLGDVHDSVLFEIREDKVDYWLPLIKDMLENPPLKELFGIELNVPLVVDFEVGDHWGDREYTS